MALTAAAITLAGCDTWSRAINYVRADNDSVCPDANILVNTSVIPVFDPEQGADPANVVYTVRMTALRSRCDYNKRNNDIDASMTITFKGTRQPGGEEARYRVPYYVAVTSGGEIVDKQIHWLELEFSKGVSSFETEELVDSIAVKVARDKKPFEYHLLTGFQLTKAQIDYNKKMGQYLP